MVAVLEAWEASATKEAILPRPVDREVCKILAERREFPVIDVLEALVTFGQPELLETEDKQVDLFSLQGEAETATVVAPISQRT